MSEVQYGVILVTSTSHALKAERVLIKEKIPCKLIPVPRQLSSECGSCIRVPREHLELAFRLLKAANVGVDGMHEI
jgi:hypothetical protein